MLQWGTLPLPKEITGGHRGKILVVDMVSLVFTGFLYPPLAWKVFFEARKVVQKIFFRWWSCTLSSRLSQEENPPEKSTQKTKFIWTSFSEQFPLGSWLVSQGRRQTFARTFRKSSYKRFWGVFRDLGWVLGPLNSGCSRRKRGICVNTDVSSCAQRKTLRIFSGYF